jgi:glycosyltransferase involved in cell wall biosynthesis
LTSPRSVSVVIPARNAERYLAAAIESVLAQAHTPLEIVVVNDGSTDATARVASSFGGAVRCVSIASAGAGAARNFGVEQSSGELLAFLDADDVWRSGKLALQIERLSSLDGPDLVFGLLDEFVSPDLTPAAAARLRARPGMHPGHVASALALTRETFDRVGPFATHFAIGEFVDWVARAKGLGLREETIEHHVVSRRVHGANTTLGKRPSLGQLTHVLKQALDRRRAEGPT